MKEYIVYKVTNLINNKIYIGKTFRGLKKRWSVHCASFKNPKVKKSYLQNAINKYGKENFKIEIIEKCNSFEEMTSKEVDYIIRLNTINPLIGYNLVIDDTNKHEWIFSEKTKTKQTIKGHNKIRNNKSGYKGVDYNIDKTHLKTPWSMCITYLGKSFRKRFDTDINAAKAYDKLAIYLYGENANINFNKEDYKNENLEEYFIKITYKKPLSSIYRGISFSKKHNLYYVRRVDKTGLYLGSCKTELEAAIFYDKIELFLNKENPKLNFPDKKEEYLREDLDKLYQKIISKRKSVNRITTSKYRGVNKHGACNGWCAEFRNGRNRYRKFFIKEEDAAKFYDEMSFKYKGLKAKTNFPIENYINQLINNLV